MSASHPGALSQVSAPSRWSLDEASEGCLDTSLGVADLGPTGSLLTRAIGTFVAAGHAAGFEFGSIRREASQASRSLGSYRTDLGEMRMKGGPEPLARRFAKVFGRSPQIAAVSAVRRSRRLFTSPILTSCARARLNPVRTTWIGFDG
jgi:hypothetical protein